MGNIATTLVDAFDRVIGAVGLIRKAKAVKDQAAGAEKSEQIDKNLKDAQLP